MAERPAFTSTGDLVPEDSCISCDQCGADAMDFAPVANRLICLECYKSWEPACDECRGTSQDLIDAGGRIVCLECIANPKGALCCE